MTYCRPGWAIRTALALLLVSTAAAAQSTRYPYTLTGEGFVKLLPLRTDLNPQQLLDREKAYTYVDGVKDAVQGQVWCDVNHVKTADLTYVIRNEIESMSAAQRRGGAAPLIMGILKREFPCRRSKK